MIKSIKCLAVALLAGSAALGCASNAAQVDVNSPTANLPECSSWTDIACNYSMDRLKKAVKEGGDVNKGELKDAESFWCYSNMDVSNINERSGQILDAIDDHTIVVTPLLAAALRHDKAAIDYILENAGPDQAHPLVNLKDGDIDVFYSVQDVAIFMNDLEALKLLVEADNGALFISEDTHVVAALTSTDIEISKYIVEKSDVKTTDSGSLVDLVNDANKVNLLPYAVAVGNMPLVEWLLGRGADINQIDKVSGNSLLHLAVGNAELNALNYLLDKGADPSVKNAEDLTPADVALELALPDAIEVFLTRGLITPTPFEGGHLLLVPGGSESYYKKLFELGADFEDEHELSLVFDSAFSSGHNLGLTDAMVDQFNYVQTNTPNVFGIAAASHDPKLVQHLIDKGFDVNYVDPSDGKTPPMIAAFEASPADAEPAADEAHKRPDLANAVVKVLLKAGAKTDVLDVNEDSPLTLAALGNNAENLKSLIEAGADVNFRGNYNITALMQAAKSESPEMVEMLLKAGADVSIRSANNETALSIAKSTNNEAIIKLLTDAGAKD